MRPPGFGGAVILPALHSAGLPARDRPTTLKLCEQLEKIESSKTYLDSLQVAEVQVRPREVLCGVSLYTHCQAFTLDRDPKFGL